MHTTDLIRTIDGIELPAAGRWPIGPGQPAVLGRTGGWRRHRCTGRIASGALVVGDVPTGSTIELRIEHLDAAGRAATTDIEARLVAGDVYGHWRLIGTASTDDIARPAIAVATYRGVYRHGDGATAWLSLDVTIGQPPDGDRTSRRRTGMFVTAEINATAPTTTSLTHGAPS